MMTAQRYRFANWCCGGTKEGSTLRATSRRSSWLTTAVVGALAAGSLILISPSVAGASSDYSHAAYQVTFSLNCNNPSAPCQNVFGLGGEWGWMALTPDGNANAQVTQCGHIVGGGGPGQAGAGHDAFDTPWFEAPAASPPTPITPLDPNGNYLFIAPSSDGFFNGLVVPATYGHYKVNFMGAKGEITIAP